MYSSVPQLLTQSPHRLSHQVPCTVRYATTNDPKTNECYNNFYKNQDATTNDTKTNECYNRFYKYNQDVTTKDPTTNECYNSFYK
jgi:hypothetical protein